MFAKGCVLGLFKATILQEPEACHDNLGARERKKRDSLAGNTPPYLSNPSFPSPDNTAGNNMTLNCTAALHGLQSGKQLSTTFYL